VGLGSTRLSQNVGLTVSLYAALTLHRPGNADDDAVLGGPLAAFEGIHRDLPIISPVCPRTRNNVADSACAQRLQERPDLCLVDSVEYLLPSNVFPPSPRPVECRGDYALPQTSS